MFGRCCLFNVHVGDMGQKHLDYILENQFSEKQDLQLDKKH